MLFRSKGFNLVGLASFAIGVLAYLAVYNPMTYEARLPIFNGLTATGFSMIIAAACYFIASKIPSLRSYLLADREDGRLAYYRKAKEQQ